MYDVVGGTVVRYVITNSYGRKPALLLSISLRA